MTLAASTAAGHLTWDAYCRAGGGYLASFSLGGDVADHQCVHEMFCAGELDDMSSRDADPYTRRSVQSAHGTPVFVSRYRARRECCRRWVPHSASWRRRWVGRWVYVVLEQTGSAGPVRAWHFARRRAADAAYDVLTLNRP